MKKKNYLDSSVPINIIQCNICAVAISCNYIPIREHYVEKFRQNKEG